MLENEKGLFIKGFLFIYSRIQDLETHVAPWCIKKHVGMLIFQILLMCMRKIFPIKCIVSKLNVKTRIMNNLSVCLDFSNFRQ